MEEIIPKVKKFDFVCHDWGSHFGLYYQNAHPEYIKTLTLIDVGMVNPFRIPLYHLLVIFSYQSWFAISYLLSQIVGNIIATTFMAIFFLPIFHYFRPTNEKIYVPVKSITPEKLYTYYYLMKAVFTGTLKLPKFPTCPTLYIVSSIMDYLRYMISHTHSLSHGIYSMVQRKMPCFMMINF